MKFETYFKLHRAANGFSQQQIRALLQKGEDIPSKDLSPEEFKDIKKMKDEFINKFESKNTDLMNEYEEIKQSSKDKQEMITKIKFRLAQMGVLAPGSAHARPSAQPPI